MHVSRGGELIAAVLARRRLLLVLVLLVLVLLGAGLGALYVYDRARADRLAVGVQVEGISIGGVSRKRALARLDSALLPRFRQPLVVAAGQRRWLLRPQAIGLRVSLAAVVAKALRVSRRGDLFARAYRELSGARLGLLLRPRVTYSHELLAAFVRRLALANVKPARDAHVVPAATALHVLPSHSGLAVRTGLLTARLRARLLNPYARRLLALPTRTIRPRVSTTALAHRYPYFITISRARRRLFLWQHLKRAKSYLIAVGRVGLETPAGRYRIDDKQINPSWHVPNSSWAGSLAGRVIPPGPGDPLKARWLGFHDGSGIHGTDDLSSLGTAASHGCIRMSIPDVIELYATVPLHTPLYIS